MKPYQEVGHRIIQLEEVNSTNDYAKNLAEKGEAEGTLVVARKQTQGRGREYRNWISTEGGLYMSFILRPAFSVKELTPITLLSAVAVLEAVEAITSLKCQVKWPNDLLLQGRKLCGILTESKIVGETVTYVVVGIGVNVNNTIEELNTGLLYPATSLREKLGYEIEIAILLKEIIQKFNKYYKLVLTKGWYVILSKWKENQLVGKQAEFNIGEDWFNLFISDICGLDHLLSDKEKVNLV